jgi:hypothetical protein
MRGLEDFSLSSEETAGAEAPFAVSTSVALWVSGDKSTLLWLENLKRAEMRKEPGGALINERERIHDDKSRCMHGSMSQPMRSRDS